MTVVHHKQQQCRRVFTIIIIALTAILGFKSLNHEPFICGDSWLNAHGVKNKCCVLLLTAIHFKRSKKERMKHQIIRVELLLSQNFVSLSVQLIRRLLPSNDDLVAITMRTVIALVSIQLRSSDSHSFCVL